MLILKEKQKTIESKCMKLQACKGNLISAEQEQGLTECIIWKGIIYNSSEMEFWLVKLKNSKKIVLFENQELEAIEEKFEFPFNSSGVQELGV